MCLPASRFLLAGIFQMLGYLPANRQFKISVDAHIDDHRAVFDGESFVDLTEVIGPIDSEAPGAKTNSQFLEIRLGDFGIFRRKALVDQIVPLLPNGVVVEHEDSERQVVADCSVEIGNIHDERGIRGEVSDPLARSRKAGAQRNGQALPNRAEIRSERPTVGAWARVLD
jgi:hypothetical protein